MYYTIYKITNLINNKCYIGKHQTKNLEDGYMGSGKLLKRAIQKHGIENFTKEILFVFDNEKEMNDKEKELVIVSEETYNLCEGGKGGFGYINNKLTYQQRFQGRVSADKKIKEIYGVNNPSQLEHNRKNNSKRFKQLHKEGKISRTDWTGKHHSIESKNKISIKNSLSQLGPNNSQFGTIWITNGIETKKIKKQCNVPKGWVKGRKI